MLPLQIIGATSSPTPNRNTDTNTLGHTYSQACTQKIHLSPDHTQKKGEKKRKKEDKIKKENQCVTFLNRVDMVASIINI